MNSRKSRNAQLDEEIRSHLQMAAGERIARGESVADAEVAARREFGNELRVKEETRESWGYAWLERLWQDVRYGLRMLRKNPGFTIVAILTLALGIGANAAIFSVIDAVLLKPLPYPHSRDLALVFDSNAGQGVAEAGISYPDLQELRRYGGAFRSFGSIALHHLTLSGIGGDPSTVATGSMTWEVLPMLEVQPLFGRVFNVRDDDPGAAPVVILSENLWRSQFGADPQILGKTAEMDQRSFTIVGVMPAGFRLPAFTEKQDVWIPLRQDPLFGGWITSRPAGHWMGVVARLNPSASFAQAAAELDSITPVLAKEFPAEGTGWKLNIVPMQQDAVANSRTALLLLWAAVGLVLLIACANVGNLLLARATTRGREIALRTALGAGRARIIRQLLTESALLGLLGAGAGILLAYGVVQMLGAHLPPEIPHWNAIRVDARVLGFALALAVLATAIFGIAPALFTTHAGMQGNLKEGGMALAGGKRSARNILAAIEVGLAAVLLIGSGLLGRSLFQLMDVNPGFNPRQLVKADISLPQFQYSKPEQWDAFMGRLLGSVQAEPGLRDSAIAVPMPLDEGFVNLVFDIPGSPPPAPGAARSADYVSVSPEYFRVMQIPLLRGRDFSAGDAMGSPLVAIISNTFARMYFPNEDPVGRQLAFGFPPNGGLQRQIVGVVGDIRDQQLSAKPGPMMYVPFAQAPFWGGAIVSRTNLDPSAVASLVRADVSKMDANLPVTDVRTLPQILQNSTAAPRFRTALLAAFGGMALLLSAAGIFGVISYSVSRRTREIGIRLALGAKPPDVLRQILIEGAKLAAIGLAIGIVAALALTHFIRGLLYQVSADDPWTFAGAALILFAVAIAACWFPAWRAMRVEPASALRYE